MDVSHPNICVSGNRFRESMTLLGLQASIFLPKIRPSHNNIPDHHHCNDRFVCILSIRYIIYYRKEKNLGMIRIPPTFRVAKSDNFFLLSAKHSIVKDIQLKHLKYLVFINSIKALTFSSVFPSFSDSRGCTRSIFWRKGSNKLVYRVICLTKRGKLKLMWGKKKT